MSISSLEINDLSHYYGDISTAKPTINSFTLSLEKGELVGLLGPSGCGKTTLLRLIAGFEKPFSGNIKLNNFLVANSEFSIPPERRGVGMVFQDYALFPHLDAWENICFGLRNKQNHDRAHWLLELLDISDFIHRYPHELSGGQQQRLALARALAPGTSLVLLDEPFSNLDVEVRLKLRSELPQILKSCNASAIIVTHDPHEALAICDRVAVMKDGNLHQCSPPSQLVQEPSTKFVAKFVLQRNLINVNVFENTILTPLGSINKPKGIKAGIKYTLLVDEDSIYIEKAHSGNSKILSREFYGNCWQLRIRCDDQIIRAVYNDYPVPSVGSKCNIRFIEEKWGLLIPGLIKCRLDL